MDAPSRCSQPSSAAYLMRVVELIFADAHLDVSHAAVLGIAL